MSSSTRHEAIDADELDLLLAQGHGYDDAVLEIRDRREAERDLQHRQPIAEDAESLGGSLPADDIARRQDRRQ